MRHKLPISQKNEWGAIVHLYWYTDYINNVSSMKFT